MKSAVLILAPGFEEVEAITPVDFLRRAGIEVTTLSIGPDLNVEGGHGISVRADAKIVDFSGTADAVLVPGGGLGAKNLASSTEAGEMILRHAKANRLVAAICAAPAVVLGPLGLLKGKRFTCFPGEEKKVSDGTFLEDRTVVDGNLITSRAAGTAQEFSEAVVSFLAGSDKARELTERTLLRV